MGQRFVVDGHEVSCGSSAFSAGPMGEPAAPASAEDRRAESPLAQIDATRTRRPPSFGRDWAELAWARPAGIGSDHAAGMKIPMAFCGPPPSRTGRNPRLDRSGEERVNALFPRSVCTAWNSAHFNKTVALLLDVGRIGKHDGNRGTLLVGSEAQHNFRGPHHDFHCR